MRSVALIALACLALASSVSCNKRAAPLPPPPPAPTTSWTPAATATVATTLMDAAGRDAWAAQWKARNQGSVPLVAIKSLDDRSGDHLPLVDLRNAMVTRLRESGGDRLTVSDGEAGSVSLGGVVTMSTGTRTNDGAAVNWYRFDLRLTDAAGESLWTGSIEQDLPPAK